MTTLDQMPQQTATGEQITFQAVLCSGPDLWLAVGVPARDRGDAERRAVARAQLEHPGRVFVTADLRKIR